LRADGCWWHDTLENLKAQRRGSADVVVAERHEELRAACAGRQWACEFLPNGHLKIEHKCDSLNPLLNLLHELKLAPLESSPAQTPWRKPSSRPSNYPMPLHDTSYKHWEGVHLGVWQRRLVIARNG